MPNRVWHEARGRGWPVHLSSVKGVWEFGLPKLHGQRVLKGMWRYCLWKNRGSKHESRKPLSTHLHGTVRKLRWPGCRWQISNLAYCGSSVTIKHSVPRRVREDYVILNIYTCVCNILILMEILADARGVGTMSGSTNKTCRPHPPQNAQNPEVLGV